MRIDGTLGVDKVKDNADMPAGCVIQVANYTTTASIIGSVAMPVDDTIPQITEGNLFLTLAFTPKKANSKLKVDISLSMNTGTAAQQGALALFKDSNANAIASSLISFGTAGYNQLQTVTFFVDAVSTSTATYTVRAGSGSTIPVAINGNTSARLLGGTCASSITITEIEQ